MGIFEEAAIFRGVTKEDARQMLNCLNPVEKTYKKKKMNHLPCRDEVTSMGVVLSGSVFIEKMMISGGGKITAFWTGLEEVRFLQKHMQRFRGRS